MKTIGKLITEAIELHELNPEIVSAQVKLRGNTLPDLMNDNVYTNCIPLLLFRDLCLSLHIPFESIESAMIPTFHLLVSKETPQSISKKSGWAPLWENEESVMKYTNRLKELMILNNHP